MEIKLEAVKSITFKNGYYESDMKVVKKDDVIQAKFSTIGVRLLFDNCWSLHFPYKDIEECFRVYGQ